MENVNEHSGFHIINEGGEISHLPQNFKKRKCLIRGCITPLNSYNMGEYCEVHKPLVAILKQNDYVKRTNASKYNR